MSTEQCTSEGQIIEGPVVRNTSLTSMMKRKRSRLLLSWKLKPNTALELIA